MKISRRKFLKGSVAIGSTFLLPTAAFAKKKRNEQKWLPAYAVLQRRNELTKRIKTAYKIFEQCELCPRECGTNRLKGELGFCRASSKVSVYAFQPHFGEETSLVGRHGSGTIFFSNCNLRCVFCQNWPIAHMGYGNKIEDSDLANMMIRLQKIGCHNINLVTPTHVMPNILNAVQIAFLKGLRIPLVYNTSGYERIEILNILDGIVDIYLPDMKYMDAEMAAKYSAGASDYPDVTKKAIIEMNRQVGEHQVDNYGNAVRGLMIRHLVMPNQVAGTKKFIQWVSENLPKTTYINIMQQYHVAYKASEYPEINRQITAEEYSEAIRFAKKLGLTNLDPKSDSFFKFIINKKEG